MTIDLKKYERLGVTIDPVIRRVFDLLMQVWECNDMLRGTDSIALAVVVLHIRDKLDHLLIEAAQAAKRAGHCVPDEKDLLHF